MMNRKIMETMIGRFKLYFQTGHGLILYLPWFITNTTIWYYLLIQEVPELEAIFPRYYLFALTFIFLYPVIAVFFGYYYVRRSELFPSEQSTIILQSPYQVDMAKALSLIAKGKNGEAVEILEKWTEYRPRRKG